MKSIIATAVSITILAACSTAGTKVDSTTVASFVKGKTTYSEVVTRLGAPTSTTHLSDGTIQAVYYYAHAQANAVSFIPVVGAFAGGATSEHSYTTLTFDANQVLVSYSTTEGGSSAGTGIITGQKQ